MSFDAPAAIVAGLIGGAVMSVILYMGIAMMPGQMKMNLFYLLGTMMGLDGATAYVAGGMIHGVMSILFALVHTALYAAFGLEAALAGWGLLFGLVHWLIVGIALGMIPAMHPKVRRGELQAPGLYATAYPAMTAMGFLTLHLLYGLLVGALYPVFA